MIKKLKVDRAIYLVNDASRTYRFWRRNPGWAGREPQENEKNKLLIEGYTRIFRAGHTKIYK